jgi:hypothetical protein
MSTSDIVISLRKLTIGSVGGFYKTVCAAVRVLMEIGLGKAIANRQLERIGAGFRPGAEKLRAIKTARAPVENEQHQTQE